MSNLIPASAPLVKMLGESNNEKMLVQLLPKDIAISDFKASAIAALAKNNKLLNCSERSFFLALLHLAQLGLLPATPLNQAHLVPFGQDCVPIIDYRGFIYLGIRGGTVRQVQAEIVHENDIFSYRKELSENGMKTFMPHEFNLDDPGAAKGYYCVITFPDLSMEPKVHYMSKAQVEKIGKRSRAWNSGPWQTDFDAMALKTVVKQAFKMVPLSSALAKAIELDNTIETDATVPDIDMATGEVEVQPKRTGRTAAIQNALKAEADKIAEPDTQDVEPIPDADEVLIPPEPEVEPVDEQPEEKFEPLSESEKGYLIGLLQQYKISPATSKKWLADKFAISSIEQIPKSRYAEVKKALLKAFGDKKAEE